MVSDSWVENRNCDLDGIYEWCGYAFFYVKFGPQDGPGGEGGDDREVRTHARTNSSAGIGVGDSRLWRLRIPLVSSR